MFWNKKPKVLEEVKIEEVKSEPIIRAGNYDKYQFCESCNWAAFIPDTCKEVCPKCGAGHVTRVSGRWLNVWVNCYIFGYFAPHKFERK